MILTDNCLGQAAMPFCVFFPFRKYLHYEKLAEECPLSGPKPQDLWDFFEEHIPQIVQNYQKEEEEWYKPSAAEESTTVLSDFVQHLLGALSSMDTNEVR